ncbi:MAG: hypothetical protein R3E79_31450 [Caldilineaceae bacterium]
MANLGSAGLNTIVWTAETLNEAFAHYPLLPAASLPMQFLVGLGLGALGLDTVTDFATLITGRDPLTGHALTPQEMFITWLAFSLPFVSAGALRGFADDAVELLDRSSSRYRVKYHYGLAAGEGETDLAGNIWISPKGSRTDRLRALYHEQVHAYILKHPLLRPLSMYGYPNSQLWRYTEEAIAESRAQLRTGGRLMDALSHPFHPGYKITTAGLLTEAGSLGLLGYSAYWLWSEATLCDPSGTC